MPPPTKVGVAGLGAIGFGMAESLSRSGFTVTGYDVNTEASSKLQRGIGQAAYSPSELATASECLICVVATSDQARNLFFEPEKGALWHLPQSSTIILGITARPDFVSTFQKDVRESGRSDISVIDCPVSGGEARAKAGTLSLLCSGDKARIAELTSILEAIGSRIHEIPGGLGAASRIKFAHQILVGVNIVAAVEISALARVSRLGMGNVHKQVMSSDGASWLFGQRVGHMVDAKSVPASSLSIILKDLSMISAYSRAHSLWLPLSFMAEQLFKFAASARWDLGDDTSLMKLYLPNESQQRENESISIEEIQTLLFGIHTAASVEAMSFARDLEADWPSLATVVEGAAGASKAFEMLLKEMGTEKAPEKFVSESLTATWTKMSSIVDKVSDYGIPLPLTSLAVQLLSPSSRSSGG